MKKRIEMLCDVRDTSGHYFAGEVRIVKPETAGYFCGNGWARDLDGELATNSADPSDVTLAVDNSKLGQATASPGVK